MNKRMNERLFSRLVQLNGQWIYVNPHQVVAIVQPEYVIWDRREYHEITQIIVDGFKVQDIYVWGKIDEVYSDIANLSFADKNASMYGIDGREYHRVHKDVLEDHMDKHY